MTTRAERFREHLGRLAGHVVRGYRKVIGPRPLYQQQRTRNLIRVQQLIQAGVLKPFRKSQVEGGRPLKSIMNEKLGNWKNRLGNHNLRKYGNLGNIKVLKLIRNKARQAQNIKNTKRKTNSARQYIQTLSVNNLTKLLTPNQLKAFSVHVRTEKIGANRIKNLSKYRTYQEYNNERAGRYTRNLNGKLSPNSLSKLRELGLEPSSSLILSQLNGDHNRFGNTRNTATMIEIINYLYEEYKKRKENKATENAQKLINLRKRINTNDRLNPRAKDIALYLHGLSNKVVNGINKTTLNSAKAKKTMSTSGNPQIPNANGNLLYNIYLKEALNLNKKLTLKERQKTLLGSVFLKPPGDGGKSASITHGNGSIYKTISRFADGFSIPS